LRGTTLVGKDLNKRGSPLIPEIGGLGVILGFYVGVSVVVVLGPRDVPGEFYYASLIAILGAGFVGLIDDMFGLRQRLKAILPFLLALPIGAVEYASGDTLILGLNVGVFVVLLVPFAISSAANATNMLEGLNGLSAGLGTIMCATLVLLGLITGNLSGLYLAFPLLGALIAFLWFNRFPARIFPGDSMTLFTGAAIAASAIVAHEKTLGALLFIPMVIEFFLKLRGRFRGENYGHLAADGKLHYEGRVESLTHLLMKRRPMKEWQIVASLWGIEAGIAIALLSVVTL
jgi:UDP-N-acetylglucosamine--dolichyl-phosphate N-acetylglucosaminephosphotransferase